MQVLRRQIFKSTGKPPKRRCISLLFFVLSPPLLMKRRFAFDVSRKHWPLDFSHLLYDACKASVGNSYANRIRGFDKHIFRLQIAMNNAACMDGFERRADLTTHGADKRFVNLSRFLFP